MPLVPMARTCQPRSQRPAGQQRQVTRVDHDGQGVRNRCQAWRAREGAHHAPASVASAVRKGCPRLGERTCARCIACACAPWLQRHCCWPSGEGAKRLCHSLEGCAAGYGLQRGVAACGLRLARGLRAHVACSSSMWRHAGARVPARLEDRRAPRSTHSMRLRTWGSAATPPKPPARSTALQLPCVRMVQ